MSLGGVKLREGQSVLLQHDASDNSENSRIINVWMFLSHFPGSQHRLSIFVLHVPIKEGKKTRSAIGEETFERGGRNRH